MPDNDPVRRHGEEPKVTIKGVKMQRKPAYNLTTKIPSEACSNRNYKKNNNNFIHQQLKTQKCVCVFD
ncbi:hypothetical protein QVD17_15860 [Tagetes erecta]|uniref:Uncharacterized protein n=1 Tax=Tagetes erecta TaxID=13708 RepID=A0AAD8KQE9_TARER|nr:hypothetical protein QVD17_15860 [Tagetes erecta]